MTVRRAKPKLVRLRKPKVDPASTFISTLVWILDKAGADRVEGNAMVYVLRNDDGSTDVTECADVFGKDDRLMGLGAIRRLEHNFMKREWPEG